MTGEPVASVQWSPVGGITTIIPKSQGGWGESLVGKTGIPSLNIGIISFVSSIVDVAGKAAGGAGTAASPWIGWESALTPGIYVYRPGVYTDDSSRTITIEGLGIGFAGVNWSGYAFLDTAQLSIAHSLNNDRSETALCVAADVSNFTESGALTKVAVYGELHNANDGSVQGIAVYGNAVVGNTETGSCIAGLFYSHHGSAGDDGTLFSIFSQVYNRAPYGSAHQKFGLRIQNLYLPSSFGIYIDDAQGAAEYGWETGIYVRDIQSVGVYVNNFLGGPPFGAGVGSYGLVIGNIGREWLWAAINIPNDIWIRCSNTSGTPGQQQLIKGNNDESTISLGVTRVNASVPANFSADTYVLLYDQSGNPCYVPAKATDW